MAERLSDPEAAVAAAFSDIAPQSRIGVAVSGGGDSMALLDLCRVCAARTGHRFSVATVDHGLRPESALEAHQVAQTCTDWGIPHQTLTLTNLEGPGNLSARARDARYDALSNWAKDQDVSVVLLGHTMDDQAETVLMRLARGSGAEGLSGMSDTMHWNSVQYRRPLLGVRRQVLRDRLVSRGIEWIDDPTNDDASYDRVKAREALSVLAPMGIGVEGLSATADRLARQRKVLEAAADNLSTNAIIWQNGIAVLNRQAFRDAIPDTAMRVLAAVLQEVGGNRYRPRFRALQPLYERIVAEDTTTVTLAHCLIHMDADSVKIEPE